MWSVRSEDNVVSWYPMKAIVVTRVGVVRVGWWSHVPGRGV